MKSFSDFLHMGGYAFYVWTAYGIWLAVMIWNIALPLMRDRQVRRRLQRKLRLEEYNR